MQRSSRNTPGTNNTTHVRNHPESYDTELGLSPRRNPNAGWSQVSSVEQYPSSARQRSSYELNSRTRRESDQPHRPSSSNYPSVTRQSDSVDTIPPRIIPRSVACNTDAAPRYNRSSRDDRRSNENRRKSDLRSEDRHHTDRYEDKTNYRRAESSGSDSSYDSDEQSYESGKYKSSSREQDYGVSRSRIPTPRKDVKLRNHDHELTKNERTLIDHLREMERLETSIDRLKSSKHSTQASLRKTTPKREKYEEAIKEPRAAYERQKRIVEQKKKGLDSKDLKGRKDLKRFTRKNLDPLREKYEIIESNLASKRSLEENLINKLDSIDEEIATKEKKLGTVRAEIAKIESDRSLDPIRLLKNARLKLSSKRDALEQEQEREKRQLQKKDALEEEEGFARLFGNEEFATIRALEKTKETLEVIERELSYLARHN